MVVALVGVVRPGMSGAVPNLIGGRTRDRSVHLGARERNGEQFEVLRFSARFDAAKNITNKLICTYFTMKSSPLFYKERERERRYTLFIKKSKKYI